MTRIHPAAVVLVIAVIILLVSSDYRRIKHERDGRELAHGGQTLSVARTEADLEAMAAGRRSNTFETWRGTKVQVLRSGPVTSKVEILTGPHAGKTGYVPTEWIK